MCDKGCLTDIKNIKEDYSELRIDLKELVELIRGQDKIISNQEKRLALLEQLLKNDSAKVKIISQRIWQVVSGVLMLVIGLLLKMM